MEDQQTLPPANALDNFFNIALDAGTRAQIKQAAVWAKISALCTFIGYGVALLVAIVGPGTFSNDSEQGARINAAVRAGNILGVLVTIAIGAIVNYFLYRFAVSTARGMDSMDTIKTNEGFNNLRIYFRITGILLIVLLSIAVLAVLILTAGLPRATGG